jgi:hypothetical protein
MLADWYYPRLLVRHLAHTSEGYLFVKVASAILFQSTEAVSRIRYSPAPFDRIRRSEVASGEHYDRVLLARSK